MTRRIARTFALALALMSLSAVGVAVAAGGGGSIVKPGKGCGDANHVHYKEALCKKPPR